MAVLKRALAMVLGLGLAPLIFAGVALAQTSGSVTISDFQFTPANMQVAQGATVTWTNNGPSNHTTTSDSGAWDSGVLGAGNNFSFKFNTPGTFAYHCTIHPNMKGTITVTPASGATGATASASPASSTASPSASTASSTSSPRPSATPVAVQLPKTGGGGPAGPGGTTIAGGLLALAGAGSVAAVLRRRSGKKES